MRIAIDHQVTSLQDAGGVSRYHYELVRHLGGRPQVVIDLLLGGNSSQLPFQQLRGDGVRVTSWRSQLKPGYARYALNALLTSAIGPLRGTYDIYHPTYHRWEKGIRCRGLVATHHDSTQERFPALFRNAAAIRARKELLYQHADVIICVSEAARQDLLELYGVAKSRTRVIHHGITPMEADTEARPPIHRPYLLYVGSRTAYKNFSALLQAYAALGSRDLRLIVAGGGPWQPDERSSIMQHGLERQVELMPRVTDGELALLYRDAELFVYPSLYEGFGLPPLEAMSAGCPVLVSGTSSLPEVCGDAAFYFDPQSAGSLESELKNLLEDDGLRRSRVGAGEAWARRYTWETAANATLRVYQELSH